MTEVGFFFVGQRCYTRCTLGNNTLTTISISKVMCVCVCVYDSERVCGIRAQLDK